MGQDLYNQVHQTLTFPLRKMTSYQYMIKQLQELMPCGHPTGALVQDTEGTAFCSVCEQESSEYDEGYWDYEVEKELDSLE